MGDKRRVEGEKGDRAMVNEVSRSLGLPDRPALSQSLKRNPGSYRDQNVKKVINQHYMHNLDDEAALTW